MRSSKIAGNGILEVDWALNGLSRIVRFRKSSLRDGMADKVTFTDGNMGDRYYLDGQYLEVSCGH